MSSIAQITEQIQQLTMAEKKQLLHYLLRETGGLEEDADEAWRNEVRERVQAIHTGKTALEAPPD